MISTMYNIQCPTMDLSADVGVMRYQLSYEATGLEVSQFVGLVCSGERTDE